MNLFISLRKSVYKIDNCGASTFDVLNISGNTKKILNNIVKVLYIKKYLKVVKRTKIKRYRISECTHTDAPFSCVTTLILKSTT